MLLKKRSSQPAFIASDGCLIRELLHPAHGDCTLDYSLAQAELAPGEATHPHRLRRQSEVYFILEGEGELHLDADSARLGAGDTALVPVGARQWIANCGTGTLRFLVIVAPPWRAADDERCD